MKILIIEKLRAGLRALKKAKKPIYSERDRARWKARNAVLSGIIRRQLCHCGARAEMHHPDYAKPLDVVWLCRVHHRELHKQQGI
jgi:hypothetical protein